MKASGDGIVETSLQARILLVESDQHLLNSRSLLLTKSDFRVFYGWQHLRRLSPTQRAKGKRRGSE